jgi:aldose 1-epimerase
MNVDEVILGTGGPLEITVLPNVGARIHRLVVLGQDLLRTPADAAMHQREPFFWGGYVMAPWCNRVLSGPMDVLGTTIDLPPNFEDGSAIHGQVYAARWQQFGAKSFRIDGGGAGWPWSYRVESTFEITELTLALNLSLINTSETAMPGGLGLHPWLAGSPIVSIDAELAYESNLDPSADPLPVSGDTDMRQPRPLTPGIDATWTGLRRPPVQLRWPELDLEARLDTTASHIVAANAPARGAVAVEPQTHAPQGLRRLVNMEAGAMTVIEPNQMLELRVEITFSRRPV